MESMFCLFFLFWSFDIMFWIHTLNELQYCCLNIHNLYIFMFHLRIVREKLHLLDSLKPLSHNVTKMFWFLVNKTSCYFSNAGSHFWRLIAMCVLCSKIEEWIEKRKQKMKMKKRAKKLPCRYEKHNMLRNCRRRFVHWNISGSWYY